MTSAAALQNFGIPRGLTRGNGGTSTSWLAHHGVMVMEKSIRRADANVATGASVAASKLSDREMAERFAHAVRGYTAAQLAKAANRTKSAAKGWLDGSRAPSSATLLNIAQDIEAVADLVMERSARKPSLYAGLQTLARTDGPDADAARAVIRLMQQSTEPPREVLAVRDLFAGRA